MKRYYYKGKEITRRKSNLILFKEMSKIGLATGLFYIVIVLAAGLGGM